jgi:hypothetical protein
MWAIIYKILSAIGTPFINMGQSVIDGIFKAKQAKVDFARDTLVGYFLQLKAEGMLDQEIVRAGVQIMIAELSSEHWIVAACRPLIVLSYTVTFLVMLALAYQGVMAPVMNDTMMAVFGVTNAYVLGYGFMRSRDKNSRNDLIKTIVNNVAGVPAKNSEMNDSIPLYGPGSKNYQDK